MKKQYNTGLISLIRYSYPITAIVSIIHRITGLIIFFVSPVFIWALGFSLISEKNFLYIRHILSHSYISIIIWFILFFVSCHIIAGIRHLIMDLGFFHQLLEAKISSVLVLILAAISGIFWGLWLWII